MQWRCCMINLNTITDLDLFILFPCIKNSAFQLVHCQVGCTVFNRHLSCVIIFEWKYVCIVRQTFSFDPFTSVMFLEKRDEMT